MADEEPQYNCKNCYDRRIVYDTTANAWVACPVCTA